LRNAIAHANIELKSYIIFEDRGNFKVKISIGDFGDFLNQLVTEWNNYEKRNNP